MSENSLAVMVAPKNLVADADGSANLTWESSYATYTVAFKVLRRSSQQQDYAVVGDISSYSCKDNACAFSDLFSQLEPSMEYSYKVQAYSIPDGRTSIPTTEAAVKYTPGLSDSMTLTLDCGDCEADENDAVIEASVTLKNNSAKDIETCAMDLAPYTLRFSVLTPGGETWYSYPAAEATKTVSIPIADKQIIAAGSAVNYKYRLSPYDEVTPEILWAPDSLLGKGFPSVKLQFIETGRYELKATFVCDSKKNPLVKHGQVTSVPVYFEVKSVPVKVESMYNGVNFAIVSRKKAFSVNDTIYFILSLSNKTNNTYKIYGDSAEIYQCKIITAAGNLVKIIPFMPLLMGPPTFVPPYDTYQQTVLWNVGDDSEKYVKGHYQLKCGLGIDYREVLLNTEFDIE